MITVENRSSPTVSVQVWYHVGSRDDPAGRSGFAHLFEHMMFKSTEYLRAEQFDRLTEDVGGANNASTGDDATEYHEVVPSNHLQTLLWAEAERMANLKVDQGNFVSERAVVEEEYRQRVLASPYGRLFNAFSSASYLEHPYKRPGIGSIADLEAATLADVVAFHARYYRPDNATLVVAGDFEPAQLDAWIDKYFAPVAKPAAPLPKFDAAEPPWPSDRVAHVTGPQVPLPAVALTWLAPPVTSPDNPALQVAAAVLASGESSRLNQSLVYRQRVATQAGFSADLRVRPRTAHRLRDRRRRQVARRRQRGAARRSHAAGEHAAQRGRARQGEDAARDRGVHVAADAVGPRLGDCRGRRDAKATPAASTPSSRTCSASPRPMSSASCAATCSTPTR